jgi:hypothetical protein
MGKDKHCELCRKKTKNALHVKKSTVVKNIEQLIGFSTVKLSLVKKTKIITYIRYLYI